MLNRRETMAVLAKKTLPTSWGSGAIRGRLSRQVRAQALFSARVTNAFFLDELRGLLARFTGEEFEGDRPQLRVELRRLLVRLKYTPERGFPGDAALGVPAAEPGSLQDLRSERRLNLIIDTQVQLIAGRLLQARGLEAERLKAFPCWELLRVSDRDVPRGTPGTGSLGWFKRWLKVGGPPQSLKFLRMVALKTDPVWDRLGALFPDGIDAGHPPFGFRSGFGWREVTQAEWESINAGVQRVPENKAVPGVTPALPGLFISAGAMGDSMLDGLERQLEKDKAALGLESWADVAAALKKKKGGGR